MRSRIWIPGTAAWLIAALIGPALVSPLLVSPAACADGVVHRFVIAAGANDGGEARVPLQYAVSDAIRFADVMVRMGGVDADDRLLLEEPDRAAFETAMQDLRERVEAARVTAGRTEVLLYYSGHADEKGLLLGGEELPYAGLRQMLDVVPADVRISVLDACASGAITRIKGGQHRPAFLVDASSDMRGYAFLTSSSADEAAQESDRIGASFFTHFLVSGMRGAADVSGDGKVTLGEAYQFAFHETLATTAGTQGGAQHPAYDINLSGTGDVVMTDVRETSAGLVLSDAIDGRFFVRDAGQRLVAELYKPAGRSVELGLEPGTYDIRLEWREELYVASARLSDGDRQVVTVEDFTLTDREPTTSRGARPGGMPPGGVRPGVQWLAGRSAIGIVIGSFSTGPKSESIDGGVVNGSYRNWNQTQAFRYAYFVRENTSVGLQIAAHGIEFDVAVGSTVSTETLVLGSVMLEGRRYLGADLAHATVRPFVVGGVGAFVASHERTQVGASVTTESGSLRAFGGQLGAGFDVPLGRHLMVGFKGAYNLATSFSQTVAGRSNYSGAELGVGVHVLFGKGLHREP